MANFAESMERAILDVVTRRMSEITEEEIGAATARVRIRMSEEMDKLALSIMQTYELQNSAYHLIITVRKPEGAA